MSTDKSSTQTHAWLFQQLKLSARSFYLTLKILPPAVRYPISLAYLLARIADTLSDHHDWPQKVRHLRLEQFRESVLSNKPYTPLTKAEIAALSASEKSILGQTSLAIEGAKHLDKVERSLVLGVFDTLTQGMLFDLDYFEDVQTPKALASRQELDRYTYMVAGCVGEFWTRLCAQNIGALSGWELDKQSHYGIAFGKALQLTNIMRDVRKDAEIGRCYIPGDILGAAGSNATDLLASPLKQELRNELLALLEQARRYYDDALTYFLAIPKTQVRLRLACLWPMIIGLYTLKGLRNHLEQQDELIPYKISRREVYRILCASFLRVWSNRLITKWCTDF
ncbi:MAG: squalene/phytoene synthase family protein [Gammaproteobacteria bacterium]|nr:squalene/phytoene synthase family protein [Gammaproteobacteria bacterium]